MIENIILEKKHYLAQLLENADSLRKKAEYDAYDDKMSEKQLDEFINIWNYTFAELIREGLAYDYIKADDSRKNIIRLTIDNVQYDCLEKDLKKILKEDFKDLISNKNAILAAKDITVINTNDNSGKLSRKEKKEAKELKDTLSKVKTSIQNNENEEEPKYELYPHYNSYDMKPKKDIPESDETKMNADFDSNTTTEKLRKTEAQKSSITSTTPTAKTNEPGNDENNSENETYIDEDFLFNENIPLETKTAIKYEKTKSMSSFVYDLYDLTLVPQGGTSGEKIKALVAPLRCEDNDTHPEIMAMLVDVYGHVSTFVSKDGLASLKIKFNENELLIRGTFSNGVFQSHIVPAGATMAMGFNLNQNAKVEKRSQHKELANFGHIAFEKYGYIFHIVPTSNKNDENGIAPSLICVEKINDPNNRTMLTTNIKGFTVFSAAALKNYQILTYWQDDFLCAEVLEA